ncbi:SDR family NAD(P)-dependent oxidoreductase [Phenylobacterium sp. LjRoot225]|uniref:SDR family NAD(P)-dependent oxidoreductase n=1 Tax=Phenylobacterium sp. LjRoot225 TaxID=3342285 RepID=UPI003ED12164
MTHSGRVAIVTGAARGLGRAIAQRLARDGAAVSAWDLNEEGVRETARLITAAGGQAIALTCNSAKADEIARGIAETHTKLGSVGILVNNAALSPFMKFQDITEQVLDDLFAVNFKGPFLCCQAVLPDMLEAGWGRIVNISSSSAQTGSARQTHYAATKAAVIGFTKSLAMELAETGITVNNVPPGFVNTEGLQESPVDVEGFAPRTPMKRAGRPENIAAAVAFLASDDADYITGHTLSVNGGRYLN